MKSILSWFCLVTIAQTACANEGLDAYRLGNYNQAASVLNSDTGKEPIKDYYLAKMRLYGYGEIKDNARAIRYFEEAAQKGLLSAQKIMASYELIELGNLEKALYWFKKAADNNDEAALMYCAAAYYYGLGVRKNQDIAQKYYIAAARQGNSIAEYSLARNFLRTKHMVNKKLGMIWLNKSLAKNNPAAELLMAKQYISGVMAPKDLVKARELINLAISQNYLPAYYQMGNLDVLEDKFEDAQKSYLKAADSEYIPAMLALANLYANEKSPFFNLYDSYLWTLKAAQLGSKTASLNLAKIYEKGLGVTADAKLAEIWQKKAKMHKRDSLASSREAVQWLTNRKFTKFNETQYNSHGILSSWHNANALRQNHYNQPPQMRHINRDMIYQPKFVLADPKFIPISEYYDILVSSQKKSLSEVWEHPVYLVPTADKSEKNIFLMKQQQASIGFDYLIQLVNDSNTSIDYKKEFDTLMTQAVIGDTAAQFDIGLMYQYGIGVEKNIEEAIKFYNLAAAQDNLPSKYNLGIIYLLGDDVEPNYKLALELLTDAAFKGNDYAEYVLARIYETGYKDKNGKEVIKADNAQAIALYNVAAANNYGLAQYRLADIMVHSKPTDISKQGTEQRNKLIKELYEKALANNVSQARLPLAFYNAMDQDVAKRQLAYEAAKKDAEAGNQEAALLLGLMYDRGIAVEENKNLAVSWYEKSGDNPVSAFILGTYAASGNNGLTKDTLRAKELLQKAVDAQFSFANLNMAILNKQEGNEFLPYLQESLAEGNSTAGLLLADYYLSQATDKEQLQDARLIYKQFAEKGDRDAQLKLAFLYETGIGGEVDFNKAEDWYKQSANQDKPLSQYLLARLYQLGKLEAGPDYEQAKLWYKKAQTKYIPAAIALGFIYDTEEENYYNAMAQYNFAHNNGDVVGSFNLALLYERGQGCAVDYNKALELYLKAAKAGHKESMVQLAGLYLNGYGVSPDVKEAFNWYINAAKLSDRDALYQLGLMHEAGVATKLDYIKAREYYQKSADLGNEKANLALARLYQYGIGNLQNVSKSLEIYENLAKNGNSYAQYQMARLCFNGVPADCNQEQGIKWLKQADSNGNQDAKAMLQWISSQLKTEISFIQPVQLSSRTMTLNTIPVDLMYLDALNAWNVGDKKVSKHILFGLLTKEPNNLLIKETYKKLMSATSLQLSELNLKLAAKH